MATAPPRQRRRRPARAVARIEAMGARCVIGPPDDAEWWGIDRFPRTGELENRPRQANSWEGSSCLIGRITVSSRRCHKSKPW